MGRRSHAGSQPTADSGSDPRPPAGADPHGEQARAGQGPTCATAWTDPGHTTLRERRRTRTVHSRDASRTGASADGRWASGCPGPGGGWWNVLESEGVVVRQSDTTSSVLCTFCLGDTVTFLMSFFTWPRSHTATRCPPTRNKDRSAARTQPHSEAPPGTEVLGTRFMKLPGSNDAQSPVVPEAEAGSPPEPGLGKSSDRGEREVAARSPGAVRTYPPHPTPVCTSGTAGTQPGAQGKGTGTPERCTRHTRSAGSCDSGPIPAAARGVGATPHLSTLTRWGSRPRGAHCPHGAAEHGESQDLPPSFPRSLRSRPPPRTAAPPRSGWAGALVSSSFHL